MPMIECDNLVKIYKTPESEVFALQGLDLAVERGEMLAVIGNSGSGKSTLLNMLGGLDVPTAGKLIVDERDMTRLNQKELIMYKRLSVGFVWQNNSRNLVPYLTAVENVELPMTILHRRGRRERAHELLDMVGLTHRRRSKLHQLSGGEQQRVAIAIALAANPPLLLADEPTGNVDSKTSDSIMELFRRLNRETGVTIVIVTHDMRLRKQVNRVVSIRDGRVSSEFLYTRSYLESIGELGEGFGHEHDGEQEEETEQKEWLAVDRHGRVTLPGDYMERLGLVGRTRIEASIEEGFIRISGGEHDAK